MKVTIDSKEPLADVLRVVSSMYDVVVTTAEGESMTTTPPGPSKRVRAASSTGAAGAARTRGRSGRAAGAAGGTVDPKSVRQWAWENGHEVSARGSLPAAVRDTYRAANPS